MVLAQIDQQVGPLTGVDMELHAGAAYRDFGLEDGLRARGATVHVPTRRLRQGEQLAFYARASR